MWIKTEGKLPLLINVFLIQIHVTCTACVHMRTRVYMYVYVHMCVRTCECVCLCVCLRPYGCLHRFVGIPLCAHGVVYTHTRTHTYLCT